MHLVTDRNRELVDRLSAWLESLDLPPEWAVEMVRDYERGEALKLQRAIEEQWAVSADNARAEHRSVECLGQCEVQMSQRLAIEIARRYRDREVHKDKAYLKKLEADHGFRFKPRYQRKAQITHPGLAA